MRPTRLPRLERSADRTLPEHRFAPSAEYSPLGLSGRSVASAIRLPPPGALPGLPRYPMGPIEWNLRGGRPPSMRRCRNFWLAILCWQDSEDSDDFLGHT